MLPDGFDVVKDAELVLATGLLAQWRHCCLLGCRVVAVAHLSGSLGLGTASAEGGRCARPARNDATTYPGVGVGVIGRGVEA